MELVGVVAVAVVEAVEAVVVEAVEDNTVSVGTVVVVVLNRVASDEPYHRCNMVDVHDYNNRYSDSMDHTPVDSTV